MQKVASRLWGLAIGVRKVAQGLGGLAAELQVFAGGLWGLGVALSLFGRGVWRGCSLGAGFRSRAAGSGGGVGFFSLRFFGSQLAGL